MNCKVMKAGGKLLGILLFAAIWLPDLAAAASKVNAIVVFASGDVQVKRSGEQAFEPLAVNDLLYAGDEIKTGESSQASLATKGGAEVRLNRPGNRGGPLG